MNLLQITRETSNKQSNLTPKVTTKINTQKNSKVSRRKEIIKTRTEINEKELKETMQRLIKLKAGSLEDKQN